MNCDEGAFQTSKLCSFSHFRLLNTQSGKAGAASKKAKASNFPRFLLPPSSFIAKVTQPSFGVVVVYALLCLSAI
nr:MAG TPA: hypothetical protein [Microviridae sp.]